MFTNPNFENWCINIIKHHKWDSHFTSKCIWDSDFFQFSRTPAAERWSHSARRNVALPAAGAAVSALGVEALRALVTWRKMEVMEVGWNPLETRWFSIFFWEWTWYNIYITWWTSINCHEFKSYELGSDNMFRIWGWTGHERVYIVFLFQWDMYGLCTCININFSKVGCKIGWERFGCKVSCTLSLSWSWIIFFEHVWFCAVKLRCWPRFWKQASALQTRT